MTRRNEKFTVEMILLYLQATAVVAELTFFAFQCSPPPPPLGLPQFDSYAAKTVHMRTLLQNQDGTFCKAS